VLSQGDVGEIGEQGGGRDAAGYWQRVGLRSDTLDIEQLLHTPL